MGYLLVKEKNLISKTSYSLTLVWIFITERCSQLLLVGVRTLSFGCCLWQSEITESESFQDGGISYQQFHFCKKLIPLKIA